MFYTLYNSLCAQHSIIIKGSGGWFQEMELNVCIQNQTQQAYNRLITTRFEGLLPFLLSYWYANEPNYNLSVVTLRIRVIWMTRQVPLHGQWYCSWNDSQLCTKTKRYRRSISFSSSLPLLLLRFKLYLPLKGKRFPWIRADQCKWGGPFFWDGRTKIALLIFQKTPPVLSPLKHGAKNWKEMQWVTLLLNLFFFHLSFFLPFYLSFSRTLFHERTKRWNMDMDHSEVMNWILPAQGLAISSEQLPISSKCHAAILELAMTSPIIPEETSFFI